MQANRKPPSPEPQMSGLGRAQHPSQDPSQGSQGVNAAARGGGRAGMRGGRGGWQGSHGRAFEPSGRGHVHGGMSRQAQQPAGPRQNHVMASAQGGVSNSLQQEHLTPAQQAIQQGKLQQQMDRKQQLQPQQGQQQQPPSVHQQRQQSGLQQQQQQQFRQHLPSMQQQQQQQQSLGVHAEPSVQGVQHSHWDTAYSDGPPKDPRQMPIGHNLGSRPGQAGSNLFSGKQQSGTAVPNTYQRASGILFEAHSAGIQQPNTAPGVNSQTGITASASRGDQVQRADVLLQYPGAAEMGNSQSVAPMPAIPATSGQRDSDNHTFSRIDQTSLSQSATHMGHAAAVTGQGARQLHVDHTAADARAQMHQHPASFPVEVTGAPTDPRRSFQTGRHSGGAAATQSLGPFTRSSSHLE